MEVTEYDLKFLHGKTSKTHNFISSCLKQLVYSQVPPFGDTVNAFKVILAEKMLLVHTPTLKAHKST